MSKKTIKTIKRKKFEIKMAKNGEEDQFWKKELLKVYVDFILLRTLIKYKI